MEEEALVTRLERRQRLGYRIEPERVPEDAPPSRCLSACCDLMATYSGSLTEKHLCAYLDELAFRRNRRRRPPGEGFVTVAQALATSAPRNERAIVARPAPTGHPLSIWSVWPPLKLRRHPGKRDPSHAAKVP
jgi:hypothetical protein